MAPIPTDGVTDHDASPTHTRTARARLRLAANRGGPAERAGRYHRRPGVRRPGGARQSRRQAAEARRLRQTVGVAEELLCQPGLLADPVVAPDRIVQLPD